MHFKKRFVYACAVIVLGLLPLGAADFDWMASLNLRSDSDPTRYRSDLMSRFKAPESQLSIILKSVGAPADAYMVLRLAEMSGRPYDTILREYNTNHKQGWGVMAKNLGIKPGSAEFKSLKSGHDMHFGDDDRNDDHGKKNKDKEHGNGKKEH